MNLKLTIEGDASQLAMVLAALGGSPAVVVDLPVLSPMPVPPMPAGNGDDENGAVDLNAPAVDSSGLPWDERIHAKTKATNESGTWRKRRGVSDTTVSTVEAELRAQIVGVPAAVPPPMPAPIPPATMQMMVPPVAPPSIVPPPIAPAPAPSPMPAPVPPMPAAQEPIATAVAQASGTLDFAQFMQHLSGQMTKVDAAGAPMVHADYLGSLTAEISAAFAPHGVPPLTAITDIATNPQMITYAMQLMQRDGRW